ncbi:uncharacterized protein THITE_2038894 [Thermothielavioides terrestris NRRL 8126]|uniref:Clr5 domain-containing protein n=1 Tax=Thermothielavioides terrestris (strain ATCC 38088 / NRRL 8126) TaxID=578455 RepID=G2QXZ7_THETT|nr:uncharacterized protein THITE_2038894 [Thermothielavioides terrestris NRRL 8126]AEO64064.1 hypothetical protein THITE_2038894 [Thermothielavioides terrestris NRRL 8126]
MTKQWDKYREIIIAEYKDHNKPLHEVRKFMVVRYGFRASTRAYRSRFDKWGIHKYSRRQRPRSVSPGTRASASDCTMRASPQPNSDVDEGSSQGASPPDATRIELLNPGAGITTPRVGLGK